MWIFLFRNRDRMYHFKNKIQCHNDNGFTLLEVVGAIALLAIVVSTVLVVTNNCMITAMDTKAKMDAFNIARENMELVLSKSVIEEFVEYGYDEINPDIEWETEVKSFTEPVSSNMWIQATCSASYTNSNSERQIVELTHWVTGLSEAEMKKIRDQKRLDGKDPDEPENDNDFEYTAAWIINNIPEDFWGIFLGLLPEPEQVLLIEEMKKRAKAGQT